MLVKRYIREAPGVTSKSYSCFRGNGKHFFAVCWERIYPRETGDGWYIVEREPEMKCGNITHTNTHTQSFIALILVLESSKKSGLVLKPTTAPGFNKLVTNKKNINTFL